MGKTLVSLVAAASLGAGLLGCASSNTHPSRNYETNAFNRYTSRAVTERDLSGLEVKQTKIGHDHYVFLKRPDFEHNVSVGGKDIPQENIFPYLAVRASEAEPYILDSEYNKGVMFTEPKNTFTAFILDPTVKGVRTNIPVTRSSTAGNEPISDFDLGKFTVPMLHMPFADGKEERFQNVRYFVTSLDGKETVALIVGGALVPNYKARVMELRDGEVYLGQEGARLIAKPQAQPTPAQDDSIIGELIHDDFK